MRKFLGLISVLTALILTLSLVGCSDNKDDGAESDLSSSSASDTAETVIKVTDAAVRSAETRSAGAGQAVEKLSLTPLTESSSFTVKNAVNYKWIAYDNYTVVQHFEDGAQLADGGYLFYIELPKTAFDHEMYFEIFAEREKVAVYSGEVAYTESDKKWYSLALGAAEWSEHTTSKYKLCFNDGGDEYKGFVFIPADSFTYRYESKSLSDIAVYVKTGIETGNGESGNGMTFNISTVMPVSYFEKTVTVAESKQGRFDLSANAALH